MQTCKNCGGDHHIQKCREILDLLFAPDDESPTQDIIGPDPEPGRRRWFAIATTAAAWPVFRSYVPVGRTVGAAHAAESPAEDPTVRLV